MCLKCRYFLTGLHTGQTSYNQTVSYDCIIPIKLVQHVPSPHKHSFHSLYTVTAPLVSISSNFYHATYKVTFLFFRYISFYLIF